MRRAAPCQVAHRDKLPPGFTEIADLVGDRPLLALLEAHGGTRLYVPKTVGEHDPLATLLGVRPAQRLARALGGDTITVPLCKRWRACMLREQGHTYAMIARRLGMAERSVWRSISAGASAQRSKASSRSSLQLELVLNDDGGP